VIWASGMCRAKDWTVEEVEPVDFVALESDDPQAVTPARPRTMKKLLGR